MSEYRFDVFGQRVAVVAADGGWVPYWLGDGKRRRADFEVPAFVGAHELAQYLADLFHESATPENAEVRRID